MIDLTPTCKNCRKFSQTRSGLFGYCAFRHCLRTRDDYVCYDAEVEPTEFIDNSRVKDKTPEEVKWLTANGFHSEQGHDQTGDNGAPAPGRGGAGGGVATGPDTAAQPAAGDVRSDPDPECTVGNTPRPTASDGVPQRAVVSSSRSGTYYRKPDYPRCYSTCGTGDGADEQTA